MQEFVVMQPMQRDLEALFRMLKVLIVDDDYHMRKVTRTLLMSIGIKTIYEANDGLSGLETIITAAPNVVILDWEMPGLSGPEFVRYVRTPDRFPLPDVPIIMLTGHGERSRVIEAVRVGVNEYLLKPVSSKALLSRIMAVMIKPRPMVKVGDYYGPEPRKIWSYKPEVAESEIFLVN
jgi:CheY-like chemotaxis protein